MANAQWCYARLSTKAISCGGWPTAIVKSRFAAEGRSGTMQHHLKYSHGSCKVVQLPLVNAFSIGLSNLNASPCKRETRYSCLGALVDPDGATASDLVSISDQLLLMASIALTYMAGVIPTDRPNLTSWRNIANNIVVHDSTASSGRKSCCYDQSLFTLHGNSILEDLVITLADGIASVYLELISVDGYLSNEKNNLGMAMCNLSTRALQRLRNEVALNQWLYQNVEAVVSMYEDRFDLCTLQSIVIEEPSKNQTEILVGGRI
ncbi:hypothetical protein GH714_025992 [Hevea brasiliensis]|uniref:Uncharacterized protein n=1 Tax=Hevea brasiliensis TaxID=3981 RepID=A0A6A6KVF7_HEVBR|nr:hypothetical protein GH714_025992 [Hevea brasiliensis]